MDERDFIAMNKQKYPKNLVLKGGCFILRLDMFEDHRKKHAVRITCMELDPDYDGEGEGIFYLNIDRIDKLITKLKEAKIYLDE